MKLNLGIFFLILMNYSFGQEYFPKNDGVKTPEKSVVAFTNAKIYVTPSNIIEGGTLLIKNGKVVASGTAVDIPKDAATIDLEGKSIYPSFIDVYSSFGIKTPKRERSNRSPQYEASRTGYYWNDHIRPETNAIDKFQYDKKSANELLKAGFGLVNTHHQDAIARGTGVLIALNQNNRASNRVLDDKSGQYFSFRKSSLSNQSYPGSIMGGMALLRQMYIDADWYAKGNTTTHDLSLAALNNNKNETQIIEAGNWLNDLRADKIADESGIQFTIVAGGNEYQRIDAIKKTNTTYILPINFPKAYDVEDPLNAAKVSLGDMKHWNQAPSNPKVFSDHGISFAFTSHSLKSPASFMNNLRKAIAYGLDKTAALEALTTVPARILKRNDIGNLNTGSHANFIISSGELFDKKSKIYEHWIQGEQHVFDDMNVKDIGGNYTLNLGGKQYDMIIKGSMKKPNIELKQDSTQLKGKMRYQGDWVTIHFAEKNANEFTRLVGPVSKNKTTLEGKAILPNGNETRWFAAKKPSENEKKSAIKKEDKNIPYIVPITYPNKAYGLTSKPKQQDILFKNMTVWTNEAAGILKNTDVLIKAGKIAKIGTNLSSGNATIIDGTGKHLSAGIIDEHSHIAASSINEGGHNSSAEVTIEDVIDPTDIDIYRSLAGGVTTIQILHGSANPIGGRSALVKLKWGGSAEDMLIENAPKFIKFALGENVKQSNWSSFSRFPQTRMGVEQLYVDYFTRAKEYDAKKKSGQAYRKDHELETIAEILNKERFISCHSYVQSEINMLMKVAEQFNFNINTFTHILEGYKVADKMKAHGAGGSTFSDWWAYKYEVNDAIPYNGAIMHEVGVTVAFNSDDSEMIRRLNQEAAKAVKYGGVSEEEAFKFITLNPAKLLHLENRIGSIKVGKDADLVLWTAHPMSVYAKAEKTLIEGAVYFDLDQDKAMRKQIKSERNALINMMLKEKNGGGTTQAPRKWKKPEIHCDFEGELVH
jgi:imidazolonepropionase-like amidohydrolase